MGFFDFFKKKKQPTTDSTFPENELEKALMQAASDVSARKNFYMKLLWNELYVLTSGNDGHEGVRTVETGETLEIVSFETGEIPVFTSTNRIFDKRIIKTVVPYSAMKGQDLFRMTQGATLVLNPYSSFGKELLPNEIESLLDGSIFEDRNEVQFEEDTPVRIGQPIKHPTELVDAMIEIFKRKPQVKAAYLALVHIQNEEAPHLMIGLDLDGDRKEVIQEAGPIAEKILEGDVIDFYQISEDGISDYFVNETEPFYERDE